MKIKLVNGFFIVVLFFVTEGLCAQGSHRPSYTGGRFNLMLNGNNSGYLKPIVKSDTLIYTVKDLKDTAAIRTKCDSIFRKYNKWYYIQYKIKKG